MKKILMTAAVLAFAACGERQADAPATGEMAPADTAMMSSDTSMMHSDSMMPRDTAR
ncbi:MAG: hypothetical protein H0T44_01935 [Gemmatimonadales bacterium]|nr:hypothetical protein [Gemmatimonadales bacterium]